MPPRSIHHVFPYHTRQIADDDAGWWRTQLGAWPVAAAMEGQDSSRTVVHVIGDHPSDDERLVVHRGAVAGPEVVPFGCDVSSSLLRALRRLGPDDVCVIHGADAPAASLCAEAARASRVVAVYHGGATGGPDRLKDLALAHVVLRPEVTATLVAAGYDPRRIHEVEPSIDQAFLEVPRAVAGDGAVRLGFVGRPTWGKGVDAIAPTVGRLRSDGVDVAVEVVGATHLDDVEPLRQQVEGLGGRFRSFGFVPNAEMPRIMATWDVLLFPSRWEGFGRSVLEAAAVGVPVVSVEGVVPERAVDGERVRGVPRDELPEAVAVLIAAGAAPVPARGARTHAAGAEDLDRILDATELRFPTPSFDAMASARSVGVVARHYEPVLSRLRPAVRVARDLRGRVGG